MKLAVRICLLEIVAVHQRVLSLVSLLNVVAPGSLSRVERELFPAGCVRVAERRKRGASRATRGTVALWRLSVLLKRNERPDPRPERVEGRDLKRETLGWNEEWNGRRAYAAKLRRR